MLAIITYLIVYYVEREKVFAWCPLLRKVVGALYYLVLYRAGVLKFRPINQ